MYQKLAHRSHSKNAVFAIVRVGINPSHISLYPAVIKMEMVGEIPVQQLRTMRIELHTEQLLLVCHMRTWDSVGRYYHANLDPETRSAYSSFAPAPSLETCTHVKFFLQGEMHKLPNDRYIFRASGE